MVDQPTEPISLAIVGPLLLCNHTLAHFLKQFPGMDVRAHALEPARIPDQTLIDVWLLNFPNPHQLDEILSSLPGKKILCISSEWSPDSVQRGLDLGLLGVVSADASPEDLLIGIREVAHGRAALSPRLAIEMVVARSRRKDLESLVSYDELTPREKEVLGLLSEGLSNKQIAQSLYLSVRTVHNHVASVFRKLGVASRIEATLLALNMGWVSLPRQE